MNIASKPISQMGFGGYAILPFPLFPLHSNTATLSSTAVAQGSQNSFSLRSLGLFISYPLNYKKSVQYISPKRLLFVPQQALLKVWCRILTRLKKKGQKKFGPLVCKETRTGICITITKLTNRYLRRLVTGEACQRLSCSSLSSHLL